MKLQFGTNVPIEVCLMTLDGETVESQYGGPQRKYTTTDRDTFYVSDMVGNIIAETCRKLKIEEREPVVICKAEVSDGRGRKAIRWQVTRVSAPHPQVGPQPDGGFRCPDGTRHTHQRRERFVPARAASCTDHPSTAASARHQRQWYRKRQQRQCPADSRGPGNHAAGLRTTG